MRTKCGNGTSWFIVRADSAELWKTRLEVKSGLCDGIVDTQRRCRVWPGVAREINTTLSKCIIREGEFMLALDMTNDHAAVIYVGRNK